MADIRQRIVIDAVDNTSKGVRSAQKNASTLNTTLTRLRATLLGFVGISIGVDVIRGFSRLSDEAVELQAKLRLLTDTTKDYNEAFSTLADLSTRTGTSFEANVTLFNRLKLAFASTGSEAQSLALNVTEVLNNSLRISGASAQEAASTIRQFSQAMASGVLRGEEFNAIMENSPRLVQALTDSLGITVGELRKLSKEGLLSAEVVRDAILDQQDAIRSQAEQLPITIGRAIENVKTAFTIYATESSEANSDIADSINLVAENFDTLADSIGLAAKATALLFTGKIVASITSRSQEIIAAKVAELNATTNAAKAEQAATAATLASARVRAAETAKAAAEKLKQEAIEKRIAAARKLIAAEERVAAAQSAALQARKTAILKQYAAAEKETALALQIIRQQDLVAEKEANIEKSVLAEELRQKKAIAAKEEQLQIEARQLLRQEEIVQQKRAAVEEAAIRETRRQEEAFDQSQRVKNAEANRLIRAQENADRRKQIAEERADILARAELREIESQKRIAIAKQKEILTNKAVADNKRETLSLDELIAKLNIKFEVDQRALGQATAKQKAALANAEAKATEAAAVLRSIETGELEQAQIREGFVLNQERIVQAQAAASSDLEAAVAKRDLIAAAQAQGVTLSELTVKQQQQNVAQVESTKLDQSRIATVRAAAEAEAAAAAVKLEALELAKKEGISQKEALFRIQQKNVATKESIAIDRQAVLAATEKQRAELQEARAVRATAAAEAEKAAATTQSNKAVFVATDLTNKLTFAQQVAAEKTRINAAATRDSVVAFTANSTATTENTVATGANTTSVGANTVARGAQTAATGASTAATTANTAATAANAAANTGLLATIGAILTKKISLIGVLGKLSPTLGAAGAVGAKAFSGLLGVIGRIGGALLGWPGLIAYVGYELTKNVVDYRLAFEALLFTIERVGVGFLNLFRDEEEAEEAIEKLRKKYSDSVDDIINKRRLQTLGFETQAEEEAQIAQDLQDKVVRLENERSKKVDERISKLSEYYSALSDFQSEAQEDRKADIEDQIAQYETEQELEIANLSDKLQNQKDFEIKSEEVRKEFEEKKLTLLLKSAKAEVKIAKDLAEELKPELEKGTKAYQEEYFERLQSAKEAYSGLVKAVRGALQAAAAEEVRFLGIARDASKKRREIEEDFTDFKRDILNTQGSFTERYWDLVAQRRAADAKLREADKAKEAGEFERANELYDEAYENLKTISGGFEDLTSASDATLSQQKLAQSSLKVTVSATERAAESYASVQDEIESKAISNAEAQAQRQEQLVLDLQNYRAELAALDADLDKQRELVVDLNTAQILASIDRIDASIKALNQTITITVRQVEENQTGGMILKRQSGGDIPDPSRFIRRRNKVPGSGSGDIVPAMLEPGEFVIRKSSVEKYGAGFMRQLNKGEIPGFNQGGVVPRPETARKILSAVGQYKLNKEDLSLVRAISSLIGSGRLSSGSTKSALSSIENIATGRSFGNFDRDFLKGLAEENKLKGIFSRNARTRPSGRSGPQLQSGEEKRRALIAQIVGRREQEKEDIQGEQFSFLGETLFLNKGGFLRKPKKGEQKAAVERGIEEILGALESAISAEIAFKQNIINRLTPGRINQRSTTGKSQYEQYAVVTANANAAKEYISRFRNLNADRLDKEDVFNLRNSIGTLLSNRVIRNQGNLTGRRTIKNRLFSIENAKNIIEQILNKANAFGNFAEGGNVDGFGTGDTIKAMLTPGEYVINRKSVEKFGEGFFDNVNRGVFPQKFADGGMVGGSVASQLSGTNRKIDVNLNVNGASAKGSFDDNAQTRLVLEQLSNASFNS
jgi:tape measure domain-containing protein